jgi:hypothetical protein
MKSLVFRCLIAQRIRLIDQQGHAGTMLNGVIVNKMQLRQRMDMDPLTQLRGARNLLRVSVHARFLQGDLNSAWQKHLGMGVIRRQLNRRQADHADTRIL